MPCQDVSEIVTIELDSRDRLRSFSLNKATCSVSVGASDVQAEQFLGQSAADLLQLSPDQAIADLSFDDLVSEFLFWKQLITLQAGLASLTGQPSPVQEKICQIDNITYGPEGTSLTGVVQLDILTEEIKACGRCAGCK